MRHLKIGVFSSEIPAAELRRQLDGLNLRAISFAVGSSFGDSADNRFTDEVGNLARTETINAILALDVKTFRYLADLKFRQCDTACGFSAPISLVDVPGHSKDGADPGAVRRWLWDNGEHGALLQIFTLSVAAADLRDL